MAAPVNRANDALGRFGEIAQRGTTKVSEGFSALRRSASRAVEGLGRFAPALAGITSAGVIGGIALLTERFTSFGSNLGIAAARSGVAADALHDLQGAARLAGSSADALTSGMTALNDGLTDAAGGRNPQLVVLLGQLGISFLGVSGRARTASQVMPELADRISRIQNPALRALVATRAFGAAGASLLPLLAQGAQGVEELSRQAERYGLVNDEGVRQANAMRMAQTELGLAIEGTGYKIAEVVGPIIVPMLKSLAGWIADNRGDIVAFFKWVAEGLKSWGEGDGPKRLMAVLESIGKIAKGTFDFLSNFQLPGWLKWLLGIRSGAETTVAPGKLLGDSLLGRLPPWLGGPALRLPGGPLGNFENGATPTGVGGASQDTNSATRQAFLDKWRPEAERIAARVGTSPENILAHWAQETGWGRREHDNNVGNLQALRPGPNTVVRGDTHADGSVYSAPFFAFRSPREAADAYADWVERHRAIGPGRSDSALDFGRRLQGAHYMENPNAAADIARTRAQVERVGQQAPVAAPPIAPVPVGGTGGQGGAGADGRVVVRVDIPNAPPGARATTIASGQGVRVETPTLGNVP